MADKKISALTPAATPLAGSEVLPIVQNNSTVKVSVANLTTGRAVTAASVSIPGVVDIGPSGVNPITLYQFGTNTPVSYIYGQTVTGDIIVTDAAAVPNVGLTAGGNVKIFKAGQGIDFSANTNAAGMTSELLNWYEEGTWTPTLTTNGFSGSVTLSSASGLYTRIGRLVTLQCTLTLSDFAYISSFTEIGGIPFTPVARSSGSYSTAHSNPGASCAVAASGTVIFATTSISTQTSTVFVFTITYAV